MNKETRNIYLELTKEVDWSICVFCKYNDGSLCASVSCKHPLEYRLLDTDEPGYDCWGFRPKRTVQLAADIVGVVLAQGWQHKGAVWWEDDGKIKICEFEG